MDASWPETRRSKTVIVVYLVTHMVDRSSNRQIMVTQSTSEAEYVSVDSAARKVMSLRRVLRSLGMTQHKTTVR